MKYLPTSGENLFQRIKRIVTNYETEHGPCSSLNVSVGDPDLTPPFTLQNMLAEAGTRNDRKIHNYRECDEPEGFGKAMVKYHTGIDILGYSHLRTLPTAGIKTIYGLLPIASGANRGSENLNLGYMRNAPAYDLIGIRSEYLGEKSMVWPIYSHQGFTLKVDNIPQDQTPPRLIVTIKPGNPCPVGASREEREEVIAYCIQNNIRLVNDAAYAALIYKDHITLTEVAKDYPELEWIEMFSISKTMNAAGWRLGAIVGSRDFVDEVQKVKENNDSGPNGPSMVAVSRYLQSEYFDKELHTIRDLYKERLNVLQKLLLDAGFQQACPTDGGLFTLWHCPRKINGIEIQNSEHCNQTIIELSGIIGVPFNGSLIDGKPELFIRYSLCASLEKKEFKERFQKALSLLEISYS